MKRFLHVVVLQNRPMHSCDNGSSSVKKEIILKQYTNNIEQIVVILWRFFLHVTFLIIPVHPPWEHWTWPWFALRAIVQTSERHYAIDWHDNSCDFSLLIMPVERQIWRNVCQSAIFLIIVNKIQDCNSFSDAGRKTWWLAREQTAPPRLSLSLFSLASGSQYISSPSVRTRYG